MPVVLPAEPVSFHPAPPRHILWLIASVIVMAAAATYTLLTWPKNTPTGTAAFWLRVAGFPALSCAISYGLRLLYFERQVERQDAHREQWQEECAEATQFAQEPLALIATGYLCSSGSAGVAGAFAGGSRPLESGIPKAGNETVRHTALLLIDDPVPAQRYASCFRELLSRLDDTLRALPLSNPLEIWLDCPENISADELRGIWQACWAEAGHRIAEAFVLARSDSMMALDTWLDGYGGTELEKYALFVGVQLYDEPMMNSAEAAAALLLGWAPMAVRNGLPVMAMLHRPVEMSGGTVRDVVHTALLWGDASPAGVEDVWQTGLAPADKSVLLEVSSGLGLGASGTEELSGFHDLDLAMGHAGVADVWLAIALSAEHATHTGKPQAIVTRRNDLRLALVQPPLRPCSNDAATPAADNTESNE